jgi:hypothetical protein
VSSKVTGLIPATDPDLGAVLSIALIALVACAPAVPAGARRRADLGSGGGVTDEAVVVEVIVVEEGGEEV